MSAVNGKKATPRPGATKAAGQPAARKRKRDRPTMADIAARIGVHPTTVSLALRSHPSIPLATRKRVLAASAEIGYVRNPLLDAFNFHRLNKRATKDGTTIAFVVDANTSPYFFGQAFHPLVYAGARAAAEAHHHSIEVFQVGEQDLSPKRLNTIIHSRGITGVLLSTFTLQTQALELDLNELAAVKIESHHLCPHIDVVTNDQCQAARLAVRRLRALGYRRIGLATARDDESRLDDNFATGVIVEQAEMPESECVPPLHFERTSLPEIGAKVEAWVKANAVDVLITNWKEFLGEPHNAQEGSWTIPCTSLRVGEDIAFASLDVPVNRPDVAGIVQNHRLVGMRAMEQLSVLVRTFHRGPPEAPSATYVPGFWKDGTTIKTKVRSSHHPFALTA
ncbi:LacI family DNA-binding transcriptional regulator [Synoicihabitans lomoniglobus]|uniref:LacI family DNA-binding transcriptional regulator n=1 Tax=Synoicihabitans lomoniglobus TaxID=2909285 RepID=A0AAF0CMV6_9BACT|nr:LacI family transcriptional regulator [Opitutaceae bacterium LMO-M01]WED63831.1 LacI family DNA-binding transcriptional regulator [Opitutaceae bacterium LMO-M01]